MMRIVRSGTLIGLVALGAGSVMADGRLIPLPPDTRLTPVPFFRYAQIDRNMNLISEWHYSRAISGGPDQACATAPIFDAYEDADYTNSTIELVDGAVNGGYDPFCGNPRRIFTIPVGAVVNEFTVAPGSEGVLVDRFITIVRWNPVNPQQLTFIVWTNEGYDANCTDVGNGEGDPYAGAPQYDGIIVQATDAGGNPTVPIAPGNYVFDVETCQAPLPPTLQMPFDGSGSYEIWYATDIDPIPGPPWTLRPAAFAGPFLWGNKPDAPGAADAPLMWVDANNDFIGTFDWFVATDCFDASGLCPDPLAPAMVFLHGFGGGPCAGNIKGDANCDGSVNNFDIDCFVAALVGGQPGWEACANPGCDFVCVNDLDGDGLVTNFDIDPFVACLLAGQSPCP